MEDGRKSGDLIDMALGLPWSDVVAFPADPSSATEARHFVRNTLGAAHLDSSVIDNVELVVSELVTNAVLHAGMGPTLTVSMTSDSVRIEVRDASTASPAMPHFGNTAATGRGLNVVSRAAKDWGYDTDQFGKTVWAEFSTLPVAGFATDHAPRVSSEVIVDSRFSGDTKLVRFVGVPVDLYIELEQSNDATLREFELLAIQIDNELEKTQQIHHQLASLVVRSGVYLNTSKTRMRSAVNRAKRRDQATVDLKQYVDEEAAAFAAESAGLMTEADSLSDQGILLTASATEEVRQLRYWFNEELQQQYFHGRPPIAFALHG